MARIFRLYQIFDPISLVFAAESREFGTEVEGHLAQCLPGFRSFWKQFPGLMTPEQLERFHRERSAVGSSSTGVDGGLMMYALYRANRP